MQPRTSPKKQAFDENEYCQKIVSMGPNVVPLIIEAAQSKSVLSYMAEMVCKRRFKRRVDRASGKRVWVFESLPGYDPGDDFPKRQWMWLLLVE